VGSAQPVGGTRRPSRAARVAGLACGLAAAALAVHSWAVASTGPALGTDLTIAAVAPGELSLVGSGAVLQSSAMHPGAAPVTGTLRIRNITGAPVRVRIRALPSTREADDTLALTATAQGRLIVAGRVGSLRRWSSRHVWIGVHGSALLRLGARLRRPAEGLIADITLEFDARPVRRR
jgi:hypothetical protein